MTGTGIFPFNIGTTTTFGGDGGPIDIRTLTLTMDRGDQLLYLGDGGRGLQDCEELNKQMGHRFQPEPTSRSMSEPGLAGAPSA
jgi:hypothetical protein